MIILIDSTHDSLLAKEDVDHSDVLLPRVVLVVSLVLKSFGTVLLSLE